ncbi:CbbQ/NirQ/NorQ C-terminal domain-containing protein [Candidatus Poribacteria bacterium]|nr:CbbQ/NirQ/NorQ C-terminal domain-containing protein [Candidatus Poribacteria bacterium]
MPQPMEKVCTGCHLIPGQYTCRTATPAFRRQLTAPATAIRSLSVTGLTQARETRTLIFAARLSPSGRRMDRQTASSIARTTEEDSTSTVMRLPLRLLKVSRSCMVALQESEVESVVNRLLQPLLTVSLETTRLITEAGFAAMLLRQRSRSAQSVETLPRHMAAASPAIPRRQSSLPA